MKNTYKQVLAVDNGCIIFELVIFFAHYMKIEVKKILSKQEMKVLELVAKGYTSEKIGGILSIATSTVQTHRRNMLKKSGLANTQQLLGMAYRESLLK